MKPRMPLGWSWSGWAAPVRAVAGLVDRVDRDAPRRRPEDLVAGEPARPGQPVDEGRRDRAATPRPADEDAATERHRLVHRGHDAVRGLVADHGPDIGRDIELAAGHQPCGRLDEELPQPLGNAALDDDPLDAEAVLPGRPEG